MPDPQHRIAQAARCGGDLALIVAGDYLMHAAGALAALDSESKISPLSSPLGTLAGFVKAAELLRFGFALVVGWTDPEGGRPWLGACSWLITIQTGGLFMRVASEPELIVQSSAGFGSGDSHSPSPRCHSRLHRLERTALVHHSC